MKSDDSIHFRLMNWGRYQRAGMEGEVPPEHAKGSSWHKYVQTSDKFLDADVPEEIDNKDAEEVQAAFMRCWVFDHKTYRLLKSVYRDGIFVRERIVRQARDRFWRFL